MSRRKSKEFEMDKVDEEILEEVEVETLDEVESETLEEIPQEEKEEVREQPKKSYVVHSVSKIYVFVRDELGHLSFIPKEKGRSYQVGESLEF